MQVDHSQTKNEEPCKEGICDGSGWVGENERCLCNLKVDIDEEMDDDS